MGRLKADIIFGTISAVSHYTSQIQCAFPTIQEPCPPSASINSIYAGASSVYYHPQTCYKTAMQIRCCPGAPLPRACCLHCFVHAHLPVPLESAIMLLRAMLWLCRQILARVLRSVSRSGRPNEGSAHDFRTLAKWRDSRSNASLGSWSAGQRLVPAISRKIRKIVH